MPKITFITAGGKESVLENVQGTLMEIAVEHGIGGIEGDCGGVGACGTCHIQVCPEWMDRVGPASKFEKSVLSSLQNTSIHSRLACQVEVTEILDGLVVRQPNSP